MTKHYIRLIATVVLSLAVVSTSRCAHQEPPTLEELETLVETLGGLLCQNDEGEVDSVFLNGTQATDADLAHLSGVTALEMLWLRDTRVTDADLAHLSGVTALETLDLSDTQVTDGGVGELQKALPNCEISR